MAQWINLFQNNGFILQTPITCILCEKMGPVHVAEPGLTMLVLISVIVANINRFVLQLSTCMRIIFEDSTAQLEIYIASYFESLFESAAFMQYNSQLTSFEAILAIATIQITHNLSGPRTCHTHGFLRQHTFVPQIIQMLVHTHVVFTHAYFYTCACVYG